ncbi:MAG: hypothetical protein AAGA76_16490 [Pseudomonadota bacterium]
MSNHKQHDSNSSGDRSKMPGERFNENHAINSPVLMRLRKKRHMSGLLCPPVGAIENTLENREKDRD